MFAAKIPITESASELRRFFDSFQDNVATVSPSILIGTCVMVLVSIYMMWRNEPKIKAVDIDGVPMKELKIPKLSRAAIIFRARQISEEGERLAQDEPYIIRNGKHSEVVIHTPEHVREFVRKDLNEHYHPADMNFGDYFNRVLGQCAGALHGDQWRTVRQHFDSVYTHGSSLKMMPVFQNEVQKWLKDLKNDALASGVGRLVINAPEACKTLPLRAIPLSFYGEAYDDQIHKELVRLSRLQLKALEYSVTGKWQMWHWFNMLPTPSKRHLDLYKHDWKAFNIDILKDAQKKGVIIPAQHVFKGVEVTDGMSMDQYLQTIDEMIFTNIGITGDIIVFMLEKLAQHPDFQQKLYEEIASRKSDKGFDLSGYVTQSTSLLHYLCTESVRLHPAIGFSPPECTAVDKVIGRYKIPARTPIVIDVRRLNTNALTWGHDGNEFRPERFAKLSPNDYRYGYVRFRVMACKASECLGRYMVDVLMKVAVITILETYSIQSVENQYTVESRQLAFVNRK